jgi:hypothetical protein
MSVRDRLASKSIQNGHGTVTIRSRNRHKTKIHAVNGIIILIFEKNSHYVPI